MMPLARRPIALLLLLGTLALASCAGPAARHEPAADSWVTAWTNATFAETPGKDTPPLKAMTLRQIVRVTAAGTGFRVRLGNYWGKEPLVVGAARVSVASKPGANDAGGWHPLQFGGRASVAIGPGAALESDPVEVPVRSGAGLTIDLYLQEIPHVLTVHSAARATSSVFAGNIATAASEPQPQHTFTRWYFLSGVDVRSNVATTVAVLGDSIADGYGCPADSYSRWPDVLSRRLEANPATANVAVINPSIGGNRLLRDGLGPHGLSRLERDIFAQHGVTTLIVCLGINDIGTGRDARKKGQPYATADDIIGGLRQLIDRAHGHGLKVIGATLTPYGQSRMYWSEEGNADRQQVNEWIRHGGSFDGVIDFDATLRDPEAPTRLLRAFDSGDHLHPSVKGYARMGESIDLGLFATRARLPNQSTTVQAR